MSLREQIRGLRRRTLAVLGSAVEVRELSAGALVSLRDALPRDVAGKPDVGRLAAALAVASTYDASGVPVFQPDDAAWLVEEGKGSALLELFAAACELNGLGGGEGDPKNSPAAPGGASPAA